MAYLHYKSNDLQSSKELLSQYAACVTQDMVLYKYPFLWKMTVWIQPTQYSIHHPVDINSSRASPLWGHIWSKWYQKYHSGTKEQKRHFRSSTNEFVGWQVGELYVFIVYTEESFWVKIHGSLLSSELECCLNAIGTVSQWSMKNNHIPQFVSKIVIKLKAIKPLFFLVHMFQLNFNPYVHFFKNLVAKPFYYNTCI